MKLLILAVSAGLLVLSACANGERPDLPRTAHTGEPRKSPDAAAGRAAGPGARKPVYPTVFCVSLSPDGTRGLSACGDTLTLWSIPDGASLRRLYPLPGPPLVGPLNSHDYEFERTIDQMAVDWKNDIAVTGDYVGMVRAWNLRTGNLVKAIHAHPDRVSAVALSADGERIYSSGFPEKGALLKVWEMRTGKHLKTLALANARENEVYHRIIPLSDGRHALLARQYDVALWDLEKDKRLWTVAAIRPEEILAATHDGRKVLTIKGSQSVDASGNVPTDAVLAVRGFDGQPLRTMSLADPANKIWHVIAFVLPDCKRALTDGDDGDLVLWDLEAGKVLAEWHSIGLAEPIRSLAVSGDGKYAMTGGENQVLRLWDLATGTLVRHLESSAEDKKQ